MIALSLSRNTCGTVQKNQVLVMSAVPEYRQKPAVAAATSVIQVLFGLRGICLDPRMVEYSSHKDGGLI